jgi:hypothetical protein
MCCLFNDIITIINGIQYESKSLIEIISRYKYLDSVTSSSVIYESEEIPIRLLKDKDSGIRIKYYKKDDKFIIYNVQIELRDNVDDIIYKLCDYYDLTKERIENYIERKINAYKTYELKRNNDNLLNVSIILETYIYKGIWSSELSIWNKKMDKDAVSYCITGGAKG